MKLDIVLRTCDSSVVHNDWRVRYCKLNKDVLLKGCLKSLVKAAEQASLLGHNIRLIVVDDHSSEDTVNRLKKLLSETLLSTTFIPMTERGYNASALLQWELCRDSDADVIYSVEDDYLHATSAVVEMLESYKLFCERLQRSDVVLYPFDDPTEYNPPNRRDFIVHGSHRHWRTGIFTTNVLFCPPKILRDNWDLFELLATKYNGDYLNPRTEHYEESNTIWKIWQSNRAVRFNPIPSLALHMQFDEQKDPFINWQQWWDLYAN